ncbi:MAG: phosphoenolpyruvate synthase [Bacteroidales bacterium]
MGNDNNYIEWFENLTSEDTPAVGGKNSSLGEMISALKQEGIKVPDGFATTANAYRKYLQANEIEERIKTLIDDYHEENISLEKAGSSIRELFLNGEMPDEIAEAINDAYEELGKRYDSQEIDIAARSSATAEDLPEASFAGQQESYLNISGKKAVIEACKKCYASLFTDRAISYRDEQGFDHLDVALSVGIQKMVRSDLSGAGVLFTLDTDSGFPDVILINAAWGLGENVVQGTVNPDQYTVFKPFLDNHNVNSIIGKQLGEKKVKAVYADDTDNPVKNVDTSDEERQSYVLSEDEILQLARWGKRIEEHYEKPMDIEWAKEGELQEIFIVQARPETVHSQEDSAASLKSYTLREDGNTLLKGLGIGHGIGTGSVQIIESAEDIEQFEENSVLVTEMTDPDWVPVMKQASAIVTNLGGRTSHAAIVSRELGIPAIVGTGSATQELENGKKVTATCLEGDEGIVYDGVLEYDEEDLDLQNLPDIKTEVMMNVASPSAAMQWWRLPCKGVGLARMEYLINNVIQIHPLALTRFDQIEDKEAKNKIEELTRRYDEKESYFIEHLARGIATIAASQYPDPVIVRMSDFKTNEYAGLIGGRQFEPEEENPMLGWRGASRYYSEEYRDGFALECRALRHVRNKMGFDNVIIMIPFCRTPEEGDKVLEVMKENGLVRGENDLKIYVMAELPTNIIQAEDFAKRFDGFSIGSNDLTQLTLGISRDAEQLTELFDESQTSVKELISTLIEKAHKSGRTVGLCGEAPSNNPDFAKFLVKAGIDSMSLSPDSVLKVIQAIAKAEEE